MKRETLYLIGIAAGAVALAAFASKNKVLENLSFKTSIAKRIYSRAIAMGMPEKIASYLVGQAWHESGRFAHKFATKYNNYFGYSRDTNSKWQSGAGSVADNGAKIAAYKSLEDSVSEVCDWLKRRVRDKKFPALTSINSPLQYAELLYKAGYYQGWANQTTAQKIASYSAGIKSGINNA